MEGLFCFKTMTINKLIYDVRDAVRQYVDDSEITDRYIAYLYNIKRAKYLRQDLNNLQRTVDNSILQKLCLELEEVPISDCNVDYSCETIIRTKQPVPKPLELHLGSAITSVRPTIKTALSFMFTNKERAIVSEYSPFSEGVFAFLDTDNYIYLISQSDAVKLMECITVTGVFEDPLELRNYKNCCGCIDVASCYDEDTTEYPLPAHHIDPIRKEIIDTLVGTLRLPDDANNDASDE